jgi:hypothetical protein
MGQVSAPVSRSSQQLNTPVSAVSSATGTATFNLQSPATGFTWSGTLTCGGAPATAIFNVTVGATNLGSWGGSSVYGPVQAFPSQQLVVTAQGLQPGTTYVITFNGSSDPDYMVAPIWPDVNSSSVISQIGSGTVAYPTTTVETDIGAAAFGPFTVPPGTRTLSITFSATASGTDPITKVRVVGITSLYNYYNQTPYLVTTASGANSYIVVVPITEIDSSFNVAMVVGGAGTTQFACTVVADTAQYDESVFYNGAVKVATAVAVGTMATGPFRLLTASVLGATSALSIGGTNVIQNNSGTVPVVLSFPQPYLIPAGVIVAAAGTGPPTIEISYAYP